MKKLCLLLATLYIPCAGAAYRCVDDKGRTHVGDTPPPGCANVVMYEVHQTGQVLRTIQPSMTPEQLKQKEIEQAKKAEADKVMFEQKRKDQALLSTYAAEKEFDVARDRNIEPLNKTIKTTNERMKAVEKREKELAEEAEFYKAGKSSAKDKGGKPKEVPKSLIEEQGRLKVEKEKMLKSIASSEKEITDMKAKFEIDKKRWVTLRNEMKNPPKSADAAKAAEGKK